MKRIGTVFLLLVYLSSLALPVLSFFYMSAIQFVSISRRMQPAAEASNILHLQMSRSQFENCQVSDHEIILGGILYDVEFLSSNNNQLSLKLIADREETHYRNLFIKTSLTAKQKPFEQRGNFLRKWLTKIYTGNNCFHYPILPNECRVPHLVDGHIPIDEVFLKAWEHPPDSSA